MFAEYDTWSPLEVRKVIGLMKSEQVCMQCVIDALPISVGAVSTELDVVCGNQKLRDLAERMKTSVPDVGCQLREAVMKRQAASITVGEEADRVSVRIYPLPDSDYLLIMSGDGDVDQASPGDEFSTLDLCGAPVIAYDHAGDILFANAQACELTGFRRDILMNLALGAICVDPDVAAATGDRDRIVTVRLASGQTSRVCAQIMPFRYHGRGAFTMTISGPAADTEKMAPVQRAAGMVAHKLNNLLTVIVSYADLVAAQYSSVRTIADDVGEIKAAASSAAGIMDKLRSFGCGKQMSAEPIVIDEWVESVQPVLNTLAKPITVAVTAQAPGATVLIQQRELESVLLALVQNGKEAIDGNSGLIRIHTERICAEVATSPGFRRLKLDSRPYVVISITDNGSGMDQEIAVRAVEPFFTTRAGADGLGLSVVYGIVTNAGGKLVISPESGGGTTVQVILPETTRRGAEDSLLST